MSEWRSTRLGEVCQLKRGYDLPTASRSEGDVPIVSSSGVTGFHSEAKVRGPGVVTGRYGTLGEVFYLHEDFWPLNTALYVCDFKGNVPRFVAALLESLELGQHDGAAAVPGVNRNQLHTLAVLCPDPATQGRIAEILDDIDALIENNRRRTELLEQMAQVIYREWFVRFRYPNHSTTALTESSTGLIPEDWEVRSFTDIATFVNGFAFKPTHWGASGQPIIKIRELKQGVTSDTPRCDRNEIAEKYWVEPGDLLFSRSADLGVYRWPGEPGLLNQHLFIVRPVGPLSSTFILHALRAAIPQFWERAQGTTMRHIKRSALTEVTTAVPVSDLIARFTAAVEPTEREILSLCQANDRLVAMRNLLLPRLVSGKVDVSKLDLDAVLAAVA